MTTHPFGEAAQAPEAPQGSDSAIAPIEDPDIAIFAALNSGDARGLQLLYDRYAGPAYSLALHLLGDERAAEDCLVDAFSAIWQRPAAVATPADLKRVLLARVNYLALQTLQTRQTNAAPAQPVTRRVPEAPAVEQPRGTTSRHGRMDPGNGVTFSVMFSVK